MRSKDYFTSNLLNTVVIGKHLTMVPNWYITHLQQEDTQTNGYGASSAFSPTCPATYIGSAAQFALCYILEFPSIVSDHVLIILIKQAKDEGISFTWINHISGSLEEASETLWNAILDPKRFRQNSSQALEFADKKIDTEWCINSWRTYFIIAWRMLKSPKLQVKWCKRISCIQRRKNSRKGNGRGCIPPLARIYIKKKKLIKMFRVHFLLYLGAYTYVGACK